MTAVRTPNALQRIRERAGLSRREFAERCREKLGGERITAARLGRIERDWRCRGFEAFAIGEVLKDLGSRQDAAFFVPDVSLDDWWGIHER